MICQTNINEFKLTRIDRVNIYFLWTKNKSDGDLEETSLTCLKFLSKQKGVNDSYTLSYLE